MKRYNPQELIHKYVNDTCSEEERALVESWHLYELASSEYRPSMENTSIVHDRMWNKLSLHAKKPRKLWPGLSITAALLFLMSVPVFLYLSQRTHPLSTPKNTSTQDITPGGNKAILTLDNGKEILLQGSNTGLIAIQNRINIHKDTAGQVSYNVQGHKKMLSTINKLETPRGGKYRLLLADGTKIWLNSASTLTYPTTFEGKDRTVILSGEAYFEVTKNSNKPFKVITRHQEVKVLGTHFNINGYPDDPQIQTTLLEGSILLSKGSNNRLLRPGQMALTKIHSENIEIEPADTEKNIAWKNDDFIFNGENLPSIMKTIARWYDVEVVYQVSPDSTRYWGVISRSKNLSEVLKMLQSSGHINSKVQGRRVIIMD
ncbi:FecR family protein [Pedobacter steynii]|uniref:FecR protein n=1 Tax=Pedobacter steynii TaxID=430522 RepID=A0A1D7QBJ2_9SPHI|nr:FecR family protein [Pedobacter steynii]AOM76068.1 hypothetical protein BFS30_02130 [Pedobacter steynii]